MVVNSFLDILPDSLSFSNFKYKDNRPMKREGLFAGKFISDREFDQKLHTVKVIYKENVQFPCFLG